MMELNVDISVLKTNTLPPLTSEVRFLHIFLRNADKVLTTKFTFQKINMSNLQNSNHRLLSFTKFMEFK